MSTNNIESQVSSTNTRFEPNEPNLGQFLDELLVNPELPKKAKKKSRGIKAIPFNDQFCSTTSLAIDERKNNFMQENWLLKSNKDYATATSSSVKDKYIYSMVESNVTAPYGNPRYSYSTPVAINEPRNYLKEQNSFSKSNNSCASMVDAEVITSKELMMCLTRSIHKEHDEHVNLSSNTENTPKNPEGEVTSFPENINYITESYSNDIWNVKHKTQCAEKMTYCRPVVNIYSQQFIYKIIERHAKLQYLVKRLVQAREKEKRDEAWNNYINELKNKHGYNDSRSSKISNIFPTQSHNSCIIDEGYKFNNSLKQSDFSGILLKDFCNAVNRIPTKENTCEARVHPSSASESYKYANNSFCFPTSSQGRRIMLNQEKQRNVYKRSINSSILGRQQLKINKSEQIFEEDNQLIKCTSIQTKVNQSCKSCQTSDIDIVGENVTTTSNNLEIVEEKEKCPCENSNKISKHISLSEIENKLDTLLKCVNIFLGEMKSNKCGNKSSSSSCCCNCESGSNKSKNETLNATNKRSITVGVAQEKSENILPFPKSPSKRQNSLDEILNEEIDKSNKIKRDLDKILCNNRSVVKVATDVPTKDNCTELTESFYSKPQDSIVEEIDRAQDRGRMAIAVNTDPLGLLALFQVSAETLRQVLSFVPRINCGFNLRRLQITSGQDTTLSRFVCTICGASFTQPYQLTDHLQKHDFGSSRNCCVCRHALETRCHNARLFPCQHCGQLFTRSYCCQLHEQSCCKRDRSLDERPSLMLLS